MLMEKMDENLYGARLRIARTFMGFTQSELGKLVGVAHQFIAAIERGQKQPNALLLQALGDVLGFNASYFSGPLVNEVKDAECNFRRRQKTPVSMRSKICARGTLLAELICFLKEELEFPDYDIPKLLVRDDREIEHAAEMCRMRWGLGLDLPITNITRVLEVLAGVPIATFKDQQVGDQVDAFSRFGDPALIMIHEKSASRTRFDIAHECGHLVMHQERADRSSVQLEQEANKFAGAFLLPRAGFIRLFPRPTSTGRIWEGLLNLKSHFRVSLGAMIKRGFDLRLIDAALYKRLYKELSVRGWIRHEPNEFEPEPPELLTTAFSQVDPQETAATLGWHLRTLEAVSGLRFATKLLAIQPKSSNVISLLKQRQQLLPST
jgi:Zn-dependent peptidase ImmA (M78 family)/DNA-binding XRE family transcriptional regulator